MTGIPSPSAEYQPTSIIPPSSGSWTVDMSVRACWHCLYQDHQTYTTQIRTLPAVKFIYLILQHLLPKGLPRMHDVGLLLGNARTLLHRIQLRLAISGALKLPELTDNGRKAFRRLAI